MEEVLTHPSAVSPLARGVWRVACCVSGFALLHLPNPSLLAAEYFDPAPLARMDAAINEAIAEGRLPGGVLWLEHRGLKYHKVYGNRSLTPEIELMTEDTIFDAASLTKVVA